MGPIVSVEWLAASVTQADLRIADVRWYLGRPGAGRREYEAGHLPSAVFLDLECDLADPGGPEVGRHPLPSRERFARALQRCGIGDDTRVIAYDDAGGAIAARLWWLLRAFGHEAVAILDGGIQAWRAAGGPIETAVPSPAPARFTGSFDSPRSVDLTGMKRLLEDPGTIVLDARAPDRYRGITEPVDARPGHIPGAKSAPFASNLESGRLRAPEALRERFVTLGVDGTRRVVCYCGSGVTACLNILALEVAGFPRALLYPGSFSQWAADPSLPVATDPE